MEMRARGAVPSSNVLAFGVVPAVQHAADQLGIQEGSDVLRLERLRFADGEPIGVQVTLLPAAGLRPLLAVDFARESLYEQLERQFGIVIDDAEEVFTSTILDQTTAQLLLVSFPSPGFLVERVASSRGRGVEYTRSVMRGDRYRVQVHLRRGTRSLETTRLAVSGRLFVNVLTHLGTSLDRRPGADMLVAAVAWTNADALQVGRHNARGPDVDLGGVRLHRAGLRRRGHSGDEPEARRLHLEPDRPGSGEAFMSRVREARGF